MEVPRSTVSLVIRKVPSVVETTPLKRVLLALYGTGHSRGGSGHRSYPACLSVRASESSDLTIFQPDTEPALMTVGHRRHADWGETAAELLLRRIKRSDSLNTNNNSSPARKWDLSPPWSNSYSRSRGRFAGGSRKCFSKKSTCQKCEIDL